MVVSIYLLGFHHLWCDHTARLVSRRNHHTGHEWLLGRSYHHDLLHSRNRHHQVYSKEHWDQMHLFCQNDESWFRCDLQKLLSFYWFQSNIQQILFSLETWRRIHFPWLKTNLEKAIEHLFGRYRGPSGWTWRNRRCLEWIYHQKWDSIWLESKHFQWSFKVDQLLVHIFSLNHEHSYHPIWNHRSKNESS